jgi:hypothetical protein
MRLEKVFISLETNVVSVISIYLTQNSKNENVCFLSIQQISSMISLCLSVHGSISLLLVKERWVNECVWCGVEKSSLPVKSQLNQRENEVVVLAVCENECLFCEIPTQHSQIESPRPSDPYDAAMSNLEMVRREMMPDSPGNLL